jgi:alkylated DNA repair dioxygenase AlkB
MQKNQSKNLKKLIYNTPDQLLCIADILHKYNLMRQKTNQIIINKYEPGEGISAHRDHIGYFTGDIATLSLGSEYVMTFRPHPKNPIVDKSIFYDVLLPVGSLAVMTNDLTTEWTHEIKKVKYDTIDGKRIKRGTRISITFRTVRDELQEN